MGSTDPRPSWDDYFLHIAEAVSTRADCSRRRVGAVLVSDHRVISTGYNGSWVGGPSCLAGECPRGRASYTEVAAGSSYDSPAGGGLCHATHAETNALLYADRADCLGSTMYVTCSPCLSCLRLLRASGVARVVFPEDECLLSTIDNIEDLAARAL